MVVSASRPASPPRPSEPRRFALPVVADELSRLARLARITEAVRDEVIPQLLARDRGADRAAPDVVRFATLVLRACPREAEAFVARLQREGVGAGRLCTGLLAGTARHLGEQWSADRLTSAEVALGTARLQRLLRILAPGLAPVAARGSRRRGASGAAALFATVPGEQHGFGLSMLAAFFRAEGWRVDLCAPEDAAALEAAIIRGRHDLVGLSIAGECVLPVLRECCERARALRAAGRRRFALVLGGPLLTGRPALADELGADGTASLPSEALVLAERLIRGPEARALAG